jgi:hypothetical protein
MRIRFFHYGLKIQLVKCCTCKKLIGVNIGCLEAGISHGKCEECYQLFIKKLKGGKNGSTKISTGK